MEKKYNVYTFIAIIALLIIGSIVTVNAAQGFQYNISLPTWVELQILSIGGNLKTVQ